MDKSLKELLLSIAEDSGGGGGGGGNAFGKIKVGTTLIEADSSQDILELAATGNISLIPDTTNDKVTIVSSGSDQNVWFGTSSTSAGTAAKTATVDSTFSLTSGNIVFIQFSSGNTASSPTLNVNSTGAIAIYKTSSAAAAYDWSAGEIIAFVYNGTHWRMVDAGYATTSYYGVTKLDSSTSSTSTSTAATPSAVKAAYDLADSKSTVTVTPITSTGTKIGTISVDGTDNDLYAPNGGGGDHEELTQAQYDALTPEEKNNGTVYFVPEGNSEQAIVFDLVPIGSIQAYGGSTAPSGWLMCDGSAVSRTTYAELYSVIGTTYGTGDGSTTFNLPDLRGRVAQGAGTLDNINYALGATKNAGLPNITGTFAKKASNGSDYEGVLSGGLVDVSGAFSIGDTNSNNVLWPTAALRTSGPYPTLVKFDASDSNPTYGNSTTVQPNAVVTNYIIKATDTTTFNVAHPVGSYFETSDSSFNPNNEWGGTWTSSTKVDDYIVEQGTSGIWTYRKWSSGIAECWGAYSETLTHYYSANGLQGYSTSSISYPTSLFIESPRITADGVIGSGFYLGTLVGYEDLTKFHLVVMSSSSGSVSCYFNINAKGKWKNDTAPTVYRWYRTA